MKRSTRGLGPRGCCGGEPMALASPWSAFSTGGLGEGALLPTRPRSMVQATPCPPRWTKLRTFSTTFTLVL